MVDIENLYSERRKNVLLPITERLEPIVREAVSGEVRIERIVLRAKTVESFVDKASNVDEDSNPKYTDPLSQIQDQVGARIITYYTDDVIRLGKRLRDFFRHIEQRDLVPESDSEFGYFGTHFVFFLPTDVFCAEITPERSPKFFELQIKTLFQHAWGEANHDLAYKANTDLNGAQRRYVAYASAQAWGADEVFNKLFNDLSTENASN